MFRSSLCAGLALTTGGLGWLGATATPAAADSAYEALARTDVSTVTIANQSIPTGIDIEGGGPVVRVRQDSLGVRDANAALPYAGDTVAGLPGLGASLFGFTAPPYPFVASSTAGEDPQTVAYPGVNLEAESGDYTTRGISTAGAPGDGASASARIDEDRTGSVTALASTATDDIKLGPYGTLSDVRTVASVVADGVTGKLTRTSTSSIGRISVPGLAFTVPKASPGAIPIPIPVPGIPNHDPIPAPPFPFPGGGTVFKDPDLGIQDGYFTVTMPGSAGPQKYAVPAQPVLDALKNAGITLRFQAPQQTATGVIAGAYVLTYTIPAPPANTYYNGPSKVTQTTSYGVASVSLHPVRDDITPGLNPPAPPAGTVPAVAGDEPGDLGALPTTGTVAGIAPAPSTDAALPTVNLVHPPEQMQLAGAGYPVGRGENGPYLALIGLALGGLVVAAAVAWFGVRSA